MSATYKAYAQLQPNEAGRNALINVQQTLPEQSDGRLIDTDELHLTLIHFGKVETVYEDVSTTHAVERSDFNTALDEYINATEALLNGAEFELPFHGYALYGPKQNTLVARFGTTDELCSLHTKLFAVLVHFFEALGVEQPIEYLAEHPNFSNASVCDAHVTLYKSYQGELPATELPTMRFTAMPVPYSE